MVIIHRTYRNFGQRLILWLTLAGFMEAIAAFLTSNPTEPTGLCKAQAFLFSWFDAAVLMWVMCITHSLWINVLREESSEKYEKWYHAIAWGLSLATAIVPLLTDDYGPAGTWCWIMGRNDRQHMLRFVLWYGPLYIGIIILFIANIIIFCRVNKATSQFTGTFSPEMEAKKKFLKDKVRSLKLYPLVYLLVSLFPIIDRIEDAINEDNPSYWLLMVHVVCNPLQGLANALVYAISTDKEVWRQCDPSGISQSMARIFRRGGGGELYISSEDGMEDSLGMGDDDSDFDSGSDDDSAA